MRNEKRAKLEATGWRIGTAGEFLGLTKQEVRLVGVSESPIFKGIVERSRASYRRSGGLTRAQMEKRLEKKR